MTRFYDNNRVLDITMRAESGEDFSQDFSQDFFQEACTKKATTKTWMLTGLTMWIIW